MTGFENFFQLYRYCSFNVLHFSRPEGFVSLEREDGSLREGFCLDGKWDGLVREFDEDRVIKVLRSYEQGELEGGRNRFRYRKDMEH